ncbi:MAG TPA: prepilin-type N-terminal cleavage/methylation domain-containing protein [Candidatus Paceibacterota bacterium]|nr:prepilin-type N-terminal cleavage/methylation domain-containing protein [Candidatus Paceibacterota bacterium]HMP19045.1 prepilin-type N-terminal cleavage/methylation domain-containing protein [Candidatus Paceibacterota bacterium]HMP85190.1 prepilin-type N-terminal cleavage/methylation domain-containing protein [Candidatus Paceibacterota bacterium]
MIFLKQKGFTLFETLIGVTIFVLVAIPAYSGFLKIIEAVKVLRIKNTAVNLANEQIEIIRNLPYSDVGIIDGIPNGKIQREQLVERAGINFSVLTSIRNIDDPFDGTIGGSPNDLSPADYKMVQITIWCQNCVFKEKMDFYTKIAPLGLETNSNNGALFVQVFDANGQPLSGANVSILNTQGTSTISINETTNNFGMFQLVDAPPGVSAYEISVSNGSNFSNDKTYAIGDISNPSPHKPHSTVAVGQVTQISFSIDRLSNLDIYTRTKTGERIPNIEFNIRGSKTIGENVYKYNLNKTTNSNGFLEIVGLEWDNYYIEILDTNWHFAGSNPFLPIQINPNSSYVIDLILESKNQNGLLIKVIDGQTNLPVSGANVSIDGPGGFKELITERGFLNQTDWSFGQGQEYFSSNNSGYFSSSDIDTNNPQGQISLSQFAGNYQSSGFLESAIFDTGTSTNFSNIFWDPADQPVLSGDESLKIQFATNQEITATTTWNFLGPDGTSETFYTTSGQPISASHFGDRYFKYKIYMETDDNSVTPILSNISITFSENFLPPGQVFFSGLSNGNYNLNVSHSIYQDFQIQIPINSPWSEYQVILSP